MFYYMIDMNNENSLGISTQDSIKGFHKVIERLVIKWQKCFYKIYDVAD